MSEELLRGRHLARGAESRVWWDVPALLEWAPPSAAPVTERPVNPHGPPGAEYRAHALSRWALPMAPCCGIQNDARRAPLSIPSQPRHATHATPWDVFKHAREIAA